MRRKKLAHKFKCSRHEQVIQIEISHDIAPEMAESLGDGVGLAIVRFAHIICEAIVKRGGRKSRNSAFVSTPHSFGDR
jgi:hypothetical protein